MYPMATRMSMNMVPPGGGGGYSEIDIEELIKKLLNKGGLNPLVSGGMALAGGIGDLLKGPSEEEKYLRWKRQVGKQVYDKISRIPEGNYMGEGDILAQLGLSRRAVRPEMNKMAFNASRYGGMSSPQSYRMIEEILGPILAGQEFDLRNQSRNLGFQRTQNKYQMMAGLGG